MRKIVTLLKPFEMKQTIYVYQDGNKIDIKQAQLSSIKKELFQLAEDYNVNEIDFIGGKFYAEKLVKEMQSQELVRYNKSKINFKVI